MTLRRIVAVWTALVGLAPAAWADPQTRAVQDEAASALMEEATWPDAAVPLTIQVEDVVRAGRRALGRKLGYVGPTTKLTAFLTKLVSRHLILRRARILTQPLGRWRHCRSLSGFISYDVLLSPAV